MLGNKTGKKSGPGKLLSFFRPSQSSKKESESVDSSQEKKKTHSSPSTKKSSFVGKDTHESHLPSSTSSEAHFVESHTKKEKPDLDNAVKVNTLALNSGVENLHPRKNLMGEHHQAFLGENPHLLSPPAHSVKVAYNEEDAAKNEAMKKKAPHLNWGDMNKTDYPLEMQKFEPGDGFEKPLLVYKKNPDATQHLDVKSSSPSGALFGVEGKAMQISASPTDKGLLYLPDRPDHISAMTINLNEARSKDTLFLTGPFNGCDFAAARGPGKDEVTVFHSHFTNEFGGKKEASSSDGEAYHVHKQEAFHEAKTRMGIDNDSEQIYMSSKEYSTRTKDQENNAEAFVYGRMNEGGKMEFFLHSAKVEGEVGSSKTTSHVPSEKLGEF